MKVADFDTEDVKGFVNPLDLLPDPLMTIESNRRLEFNKIATEFMGWGEGDYVAVLEDDDNYIFYCIPGLLLLKYKNTNLEVLPSTVRNMKGYWRVSVNSTVVAQLLLSTFKLDSYTLKPATMQIVQNFN